MTPKAKFESLLKPHFDSLYASARRLTPTTADAEDLVQDVVLKAFQKLDEFERIEYPRAWLLKMTYHTFVDQQRKAQRSPVLTAPTGQDSSDPDELRATSFIPDDAAERELQATRIMMAMRRIDDETAALVVLRDVEGLSISELEALTRLPSGTIKAKLHRGRTRLGRLLAAERDDGGAES